MYNHLTKIQLTGAVKVFVLHIVYENTIILYKVRYFSPNEGQYESYTFSLPRSVDAAIRIFTVNLLNTAL
jgi:hypothetical protein